MGLFLRGDVSILIATDLAARGLDVVGVGLVINFDAPRSGDDYLHRTGRTGRAGEKGVAITLVDSMEWNRMEGIARYLNLDIVRRGIKGLEARFQGVTRRKPTARALEAARAKARSEARQAAPKPKERERNRKNIGKRRKPSPGNSAEAGTQAGFGPPKKIKPNPPRGTS
jgi:superfamily II DNA/RNA helicase